MLIGYVCAPMEEDTEPQRQALVRAGCGVIYEDRYFGAGLPGLAAALDNAGEADTLVVLSLDRLGCDMKQLFHLSGELERRKIRLKSLREMIDTGRAGSRFFQHLASLAGMEHELDIRRRRAWVAAARRGHQKR